MKFIQVRFGTYRGTLPPSAMIAERKMLKDKNSLPRYAERVPYIVIENSFSKALKDQLMSPEEFFNATNARINSKYYIEKQILPVIHRFLEPLDINVDDWYNKYPRPKKGSFNIYHNLKTKDKENKNLYDFFKKNSNGILNKHSSNPFTSKILEENEKERLNVVIDSFREEYRAKQIEEFNELCKFCSEFGKFNVIKDLEDVVPCINTQCKIFYEKMRIGKHWESNY